MDFYNKWKAEADSILDQFEKDEIALNSEELKDKFEMLKKQMKNIAVFDRITFSKIQVFNWYY